jgi:hypothetical protein
MTTMCQKNTKNIAVTRWNPVGEMGMGCTNWFLKGPEQLRRASTCLT